MSGEAVSPRLAAIRVVGGSRLGEVHEEGTPARLKTLRRSRIDPNIALHERRSAKAAGRRMRVESESVAAAAAVVAG